MAAVIVLGGCGFAAKVAEILGQHVQIDSENVVLSKYPAIPSDVLSINNLNSKTSVIEVLNYLNLHSYVVSFCKSSDRINILLKARDFGLRSCSSIH